MAIWPEGVETTALTWGDARRPDGEELGSTMTVELIPPAGTRALTWTGDGTPMLDIAGEQVVEVGEAGRLELPVVDQLGWIDDAGKPVTGWAYRLTQSIGRVSRVKEIRPTLGSPDLDFDRIPTTRVFLIRDTLVGSNVARVEASAAPEGCPAPYAFRLGSETASAVDGRTSPADSWPSLRTGKMLFRISGDAIATYGGKPGYRRPTQPPTVTDGAIWIDTSGAPVAKTPIRRKAYVVDRSGGRAASIFTTAAGWEITRDTDGTAIPPLATLIAEGYSTLAIDCGYASISAAQKTLLADAFAAGMSVFSAGNDTSSLPPLYSSTGSRADYKTSPTRPYGATPLSSGWSAWTESDNNLYLAGLDAAAQVFAVVDVAGVDRPVGVFIDAGVKKWVHIQSYTYNALYAAFAAFFANTWVPTAMPKKSELKLGLRWGTVYGNSAGHAPNGYATVYPRVSSLDMLEWTHFDVVYEFTLPEGAVPRITPNIGTDSGATWYLANAQYELVN